MIMEILAIEGLDGGQIAQPLYYFIIVLLNAGSAIAAVALVTHLMKIQASQTFNSDTGDEMREVLYTVVAIIFFALVPVIWVLVQVLFGLDPIPIGGT